jgi:nucleotide-binding universal stress UspA family protein
VKEKEQVSIVPTKILVATDGSTDANLAVSVAVDLSERTEAELHVVHARREWQALPLARPGLTYPSLEAITLHEMCEHEAERLLEEQVGSIRDAGRNVAGAHLRHGRPADEIAALAQELQAGIVVVGSRGAGPVKRLVTGSVSEGVVSLAPCPVLVVRGGEGVWPPSTVVVGDDSSTEAQRAGELAAAIGRLFEARTLLVWAYPPAMVRVRRTSRVRRSEEQLTRGHEYLKERAAELEHVLGKLPETRVATADPAAAIQEAAEEHGGRTLVAVGRRGLDAVKRFALGSVSAGILRAVSVPVLIVPSSSKPHQ